jgi:hypothetical protein
MLLSLGYYSARANIILNKPGVAFDQRALRVKTDNPYRYTSIRPDGDLDPLRFVAVIRAPYSDESTQYFEEGFLCRACASRGLEH